MCAQSLKELTGKGVGCLLVVDPASGQLLGTFTDGDLRRTLQGRGAQVTHHRLCPLMFTQTATCAVSLGPSLFAVLTFSVPAFQRQYTGLLITPCRRTDVNGYVMSAVVSITPLSISSAALTIRDHHNEGTALTQRLWLAGNRDEAA